MADGHAESSGLVGKMWDNLVIRANIVEQSDTSTLLALLRVDKATFGLAVSQLYRSVSDLEATQKRLNSVKSSTRCAAYARAIRHIDGVDLETSNIGLLRLTLPDLRSVSVRNRGRTGRTGKAGALTWKIDDQGGVADPVYTMDGWDDQALWDVKIKHIKAILPEDWPITFRPKEVTIRDAATATRWLAASSSDEFPLNMPQKLVIHALEQSTQELVYDFIAEQPIDRVIDEAWLSTGTKSDTVSGPGPSVAVKSPFRAICNALRSCTNNVKHMRLFGLSLPMSWLDDLLPVLVTHRTTNIRVWLSPKHLEILAASWGGRERLARHMGNGGRRVANRLDLSSDHDATSILSKLLSDRQWIQNLARGLLFATSETSRHRLNIVLANFPDGTGDPETLRQASDKLTDTLNGTIDTIIEMIRDLRTPGFRLLPAAERRSTSPAPAPIAAVEVEIKAEGAEEDGRNEASGMTPEEASGITEDELSLQ